jgi:alanine racemase
MPLPANSRLSIDLDALAHNYGVLVAQAGGAEVAPVVKSDGYGLGAGWIARRLWLEGARSFFVARVSEGEALRRDLGDQRPAVIFVLDGFPAGIGERLTSARLTPVLSTLPQVTAARAFAAARGEPLKAALHVDSGMNRFGITPDQARALASSHDGLAGVDIGLVMSHLGSSPEVGHPRNALQLERFSAIRSLFPVARASFANSGGTFLGPDFCFDVVRPGISLYGGGPEERPDSRLKAVAKLEAPIVDIRTIEPGEFVGYGSQLVAEASTRVAVVAAGYADGVMRSAKQRGYAWYAGKRRRLLTVNMDLILIELGQDAAGVGDWVELLGPNAHLDDLAAAADTVAHECLVRLSARADRIYLGEGSSGV